MNPEQYSRRGGSGGAPEPFEIHTHGKKRFEIRKDEPAVEGQPVSDTPAAPTGAGKGVFFFRNDGAGKSQLCVRFPSGAVQILATEP